jgi:hypothetical protein
MKRDNSTGRIYHVRHDWESDGSLSQTIIEAIAAMQEIDSDDVEPLETVVDPDAMDRLFGPRREAPRRDEEGHIRFELDGYDVRVTWSGDVSIRRDDASQDEDDITTEAAFEGELARLIREAEANGVAVDGGWACKDDSEHPEWGIEIYEVDSSR